MSMGQRIIRSERGLSVVSVRDDGERRIEIALEDYGDFLDLRLGVSRNVTNTMAVTPELARAIHEWLGAWLERQEETPAAEYDPYVWVGPTAIIVLAAPMAQEPQTVNNYTDNRSVTIHTPAAGGMPLLADREREVQAQQGGRVFRVVGEREWGD